MQNLVEQDLVEQELFEQGLFEPALFIHKTSCTSEEIAAKLLGWMLGPLRLDDINIDKEQISEKELPFLASLNKSISYHLEELRERALQELINVWLPFSESNKDSEDYALLKKNLDAKMAEVERIDNLFKSADSYLLDIDEEIDKGELSALKIDKDATGKSGVTHVKLRSADRWTQEKYGVSILNRSPSEPATEESLKQSMEQSVHGAKSNLSLSETKANNLYTTLAILVTAYASSATAYKKSEGEPNVSSIASRLEKLAKELNNKEALENQSSESIKTRIEEAMRIMKSKLRKNNQHI